MQGFAELLSKLFEDIFGYDSGFEEAKEAFAQSVFNFKSFITEFFTNSVQIIDTGNAFVFDNPGAITFIGTCFSLWAIIAVARAAKNCIGG